MENFLTGQATTGCSRKIHINWKSKKLYQVK